MNSLQLARAPISGIYIMITKYICHCVSSGGVFIATLFGLALAMVTLAVEIFLHKRRQNARGRVAPKHHNFYREYLSTKEFGSQPPVGKPSKLIRPVAKVITVFPRGQLY